MNLEGDDFGKNGGHVKHAFRAAFYHLRRRSTLEEAVRDVLRRGGDTDTNACIVGGLLGALHGYCLIPEHLKKRVLTFDCTKPVGLNHRRPHTYSVGRCFPLVEHMAPFQEPVAAPVKIVRVVKMGGAEMSAPAQEEPAWEVVDTIPVRYTSKEIEDLRKDMLTLVERIATAWEKNEPLDWVSKKQAEYVESILHLEKLRMMNY
jgi:hypothetical protein